MKRALYLAYQWLIAVPILVVLTAITAIVTIIMTAICGNHFWGYYPAHYWSRIDPHTSYVFVANHQGAFDIWAIYGYLNHDFKWLMKKELEKIFLVGYACKRAGHIFVDDTKISGIRETIEESEKQLRGGMSLVIIRRFIRVKRASTPRCSWLSVESQSNQLCRLICAITMNR